MPRHSVQLVDMADSMCSSSDGEQQTSSCIANDVIAETVPRSSRPILVCNADDADDALTISTFDVATPVLPGRRRQCRVRPGTARRLQPDRVRNAYLYARQLAAWQAYDDVAKEVETPQSEVDDELIAENKHATTAALDSTLIDKKVKRTVAEYREMRAV